MAPEEAGAPAGPERSGGARQRLRRQADERRDKALRRTGSAAEWRKRRLIPIWNGMTNLNLSPGCLTFFVDETGHETVVKGHPVYGLGGCAVLCCHLDAIIRAPWRAVPHAGTRPPGPPPPPA